MTKRVETYCTQSLLANGFVFNDAKTVMLHAPGHWRSVHNVASELHNYASIIRNLTTSCNCFIGKLNGEDIEIYARSDKRLIERIEEVIGLRFDSIVLRGKS
ncbi:MAG: hypothetical protein GQ475_00045 [Methylococcaceae bacterium]|nr:hypothetical protein [Methylococcaceae bacterium]